MLQNEFIFIRHFSYMGPSLPTLQIECHAFSQQRRCLEKATHSLVKLELFFGIVNITVKVK
jgi:hypothetical protein